MNNQGNTPKLEDLRKKYPELFKRGPSRGFECGDGWYNLLDNLLHVIQHKLRRFREVAEIREKVLSKGEEPLPWIAEYFGKNPKDPLKSFQIDQIKEKFGGLRFYWNCKASSEETHAVEGAVALAESLSYSICEECGQAGKTENFGWIRTLCSRHSEEARVRREKEALEDEDDEDSSSIDNWHSLPDGSRVIEDTYNEIYEVFTKNGEKWLRQVAWQIPDERPISKDERRIDWEASAFMDQPWYRI